MIEAGIPMSRDLDEIDNRFLTVTVADQEILEAFKQLATLREPGPDGTQEMVKSVSDMVKSFFIISKSFK